MRTAPDTERAVADWLVGTLDLNGEIHADWQVGRIALVELGRRFTAVRLSADIVHAAATRCTVSAQLSRGRVTNRVSMGAPLRRTRQPAADVSPGTGRTFPQWQRPSPSQASVVPQSRELRGHHRQVMGRRPCAPLCSAAGLQPPTVGAFLQPCVSPGGLCTSRRPVGRSHQIAAQGEEVVVAGAHAWIYKDLPAVRRRVSHIRVWCPAALFRNTGVRNAEVPEIQGLAVPLMSNSPPQLLILPGHWRCLPTGKPVKLAGNAPAATH